MGSGKSTIGRLLAEDLHVPFIDLDDQIEQKEGVSVSRIFAEKGEDFFRGLEAAVLREMVADESSFVLACGGGTPCFFENMAFMNGQGITIWLNTPEEVMVERLLMAPDQRPLVSGLSREALAAFVSERLSQRKQWYSQARLVINTSSLDLKEIKNQLIAYA
jgi:shikimate kinase